MADVTQFYTSGPSYVQVDTGSGLVQLGWAENGINISSQASYEDIISDLGGSQIGTDFQYLGQEVIITATLTKYNETNLYNMLARIHGNTTGGTSAGLIGGLMNGQGLSQRLLIVCPYANLTAFSTGAGGAEVPAYNFLSTYLISCEENLGTRVKNAKLQWRALPVWSVVSGGLSQSTIWNNSVTGAVAPV